MEIVEGRCRHKYKEVEKEERHGRSLRYVVFQKTNPALLAVIGSKGKTSVLDKLRDRSDVLIQQKPQHFAGKATVPDRVICHREIDKS